MTGKYPARIGLTDFIGGTRRGKLNPALTSTTSRCRRPPSPKSTSPPAMPPGSWASGTSAARDLGLWNKASISTSRARAGAPPTYFSPYKMPALSDGPEGEYLTDRLASEAVSFIKQHRNRPFLLWCCPYAVHIPLQAKPELVARFENKARRSSGTRGPRFRPEGTRKDRQFRITPSTLRYLPVLTRPSAAS